MPIAPQLPVVTTKHNLQRLSGICWGQPLLENIVTSLASHTENFGSLLAGDPVNLIQNPSLASFFFKYQASVSPFVQHLSDLSFFWLNRPACLSSDAEVLWDYRTVPSGQPLAGLSQAGLHAFRVTLDQRPSASSHPNLALLSSASISKSADSPSE